MTSPRVSVGVPVYNAERYLPNALTRLLEQDFEDFELIICDNASTDGTEEICRGFVQRDRRVRYFRNSTNIGLAANHNRTFELSTAPYFKWAAHDDDFPSSMLGRFFRVFEEGPPTISVVYSHCEYIDELGNVQGVESDGVNSNDPRPHVRLTRLLWNVHMFNSIYGLMRSDMFRKTRRHGMYPMADHVLLAELAMLGTFVEIPEPLLRIRRHGGRTFTANKTPQAIRELFTPGRGHEFSPLTIRGRMKFELVRSTVLLPLPLKNKVMCTAVSAVVPQWRAFKAFGGLQKRKLLRMLSPGLSRS